MRGRWVILLTYRDRIGTEWAVHRDDAPPAPEPKKTRRTADTKRFATEADARRYIDSNPARWPGLMPIASELTEREANPRKKLPPETKQGTLF
jgi:hypothetical protein